MSSLEIVVNIDVCTARKTAPFATPPKNISPRTSHRFVSPSISTNSARKTAQAGRPEAGHDTGPDPRVQATERLRGKAHPQGFHERGGAGADRRLVHDLLEEDRREVEAAQEDTGAEREHDVGGTE